MTWSHPSLIDCFLSWALAGALATPAAPSPAEKQVYHRGVAGHVRKGKSSWISWHGHKPCDTQVLLETKQTWARWLCSCLVPTVLVTALARGRAWGGCWQGLGDSDCFLINEFDFRNLPSSCSSPPLPSSRTTSAWSLQHSFSLFSHPFGNWVTVSACLF